LKAKEVSWGSMGSWKTRPPNPNGSDGRRGCGHVRGDR